MPFTKKQWWKDYFSFTKKERLGIIVLLVVIITVFILPAFFSKPKLPEPATVKEFKEQVAKLEVKKDSFSSYKSPDKESDFTGEYNHYSTEPIVSTGSLFYFDPNTASAGDWKKLGLRDKTIHTIQNYLSKGGKFRKPEDILKIYGLPEQDAQMLLPYVKIAGETNYNTNAYPKDEKVYPSNEHKKENFSIIDVNSADAEALKTLPGIGSVLSDRIIKFREKLGGFYSVDQIGETYGLPDSVFQKIKTRFTVSQGNIKMININIATANDLKSHPYIKWNVANAIYQYRLQHGDFQSVNDINKIAIVTPELFEKIAPYFSLK